MAHITLEDIKKAIRNIDEAEYDLIPELTEIQKVEMKIASRYLKAICGKPTDKKGSMMTLWGIDIVKSDMESKDV